MINFACISPHPPLLLPLVGSKEDREKVKSTVGALNKLGNEFKKLNPDVLIISSPHTEWGFDVPLHFLAKDFKGKIERYLTDSENPESYFIKGKEISLEKDKKYALIASGDLSHCLKVDGPYGFNPDGPKFDEALITLLKEKNIKSILKLNEAYPEAGECGLRSFCFLLGTLEGSGINWQPEVLSYEWPFGVGYSVINFKL